MVLWFHLVSGAVWLGGLITLGAIVPVLRGQGVDRSVIVAVARRFGQVSWIALGVSVLSGGWMAIDFLDRPVLALKIGAVALMAGLAGWHQFAARGQSPRMRGILQGLILLVSLIVFGIGISI